MVDQYALEASSESLPQCGSQTMERSKEVLLCFLFRPVVKLGEDAVRG